MVLASSRALLAAAIALAGAMTTGTTASLTSAAAENRLADEPWSLEQRRHHARIAGAIAVRKACGASAEQPQGRAAQSARAHATPSAQRHDHAEQPAFLINHSGLPDIDPDKHRLVIHGLSSSRSESRWKRCRATRWYRA